MKNEIKTFDDFVDETGREVDHQLRKWGEQYHSPDYWLGIVGEEFGEVAKAVIERNRTATAKEVVHLAACLYQLYFAVASEPKTRWEEVAWPD